MTCYWPDCGQDAHFVIVLGCLDQLHVIDRLVCDEHAEEITVKQKKGRVYCPGCHKDGSAPWDNLNPVDLIVTGTL